MNYQYEKMLVSRGFEKPDALFKTEVGVVLKIMIPLKKMRLYPWRSMEEYNKFFDASECSNNAHIARRNDE